MTSWAAIVAISVSLLAFSGCGDDNDFANEPRPAAEIVVSTAIAPTGVTLSPSHFGAGPVELLVSNQTRTSQRLTLETRQADGEGGRELRQTTAPINPGDTASLKANVGPGTYTVSVADDGVAPARVEVDGARESSTDRLLQP